LRIPSPALVRWSRTSCPVILFSPAAATTVLRLPQLHPS
jgi:hypothetical protein